MFNGRPKLGEPCADVSRVRPPAHDVDHLRDRQGHLEENDGIRATLCSCRAVYRAVRSVIYEWLHP